MRHASRPTPLPLRAYRAGRVFVHLLEGAITTSLLFPLLRPRTQRILVRVWSRRLLRILRIEMRTQGELCTTKANLLIVANHVSWLDIFVLNALQPARFVAKAELARWPIIGHMLRRVGTMFVERARKSDARRVNTDTTNALASGDVVAIFPEGRTTDGSDVMPFKSALLQSIIDAKGRVQPLAIRYRTATGEASALPVYKGVTLLASLWRITGARSSVVELRAGSQLRADTGEHRRELAQRAESAVRAALLDAATVPVASAWRGPVTTF